MIKQLFNVGVACMAQLLQSGISNQLFNVEVACKVQLLRSRD
jgi:hypothetical protein